MKLLICTYQRPDGSTYTDSRRIDEKVSPEIAEQGAFTTLSAANRDATLISRRVGDSTAVRVASKRNTTIGDNVLDPPKEDGRDFHAGVQHSDAVGQLEDAVDKPVDAPEPATGAVQSETSENDAFAGLTDTADAGDTPPDSPDEADAPSTPSKKKK
ncbi:hypothetical protein POLUDNITSA_00610 [Brevundimonas phage vB_BpoS-Poludnitsa]|nr:hypothetical protein POLUDNITSA_00610 [Brevundimonas phage vB_BpoS-Poludnitsa]